MANRKISENSLKNLRKGKKINDEIAKIYQEKSVEARRENKQEKIKRLEANDYLWDKFYSPDDLDKLFGELKPKEKLDLLKALLPKDKQDINLTGGVEVQKVFITEKEHKATRKHIQDVINEQ